MEDLRFIPSQQRALVTDRERVVGRRLSNGTGGVLLVDQAARGRGERGLARSAARRAAFAPGKTRRTLSFSPCSKDAAPLRTRS